ncbi:MULTISPECIES: putative holin [Enterobacteriaceae]|uniref:putative holin n=1 Tax=Enterobacteriaceae TaxID=543 RepID=UPI0011D2AE1D|nr:MULTISPECIES: putative holin [Enterobacteriaceae]
MEKNIPTGRYMQDFSGLIDIHHYGYDMLTFNFNNTDMSIAVASLSGALVSVFAQQRSGRYHKITAFFVSFTMGIVGADATLEILGIFAPGVFSGERAVGAFFCSALIITVIINIMRLIDYNMKKNTGKHEE